MADFDDERINEYLADKMGIDPDLNDEAYNKPKQMVRYAGGIAGTYLKMVPRELLDLFYRYANGGAIGTQYKCVDVVPEILQHYQRFYDAQPSWREPSMRPRNDIKPEDTYDFYGKIARYDLHNPTRNYADHGSMTRTITITIGDRAFSVAVPFPEHRYLSGYFTFYGDIAVCANNDDAFPPCVVTDIRGTPMVIQPIISPAVVSHMEYCSSYSLRHYWTVGMWQHKHVYESDQFGNVLRIAFVGDARMYHHNRIDSRGNIYDDCGDGYRIEPIWHDYYPNMTLPTAPPVRTPLNLHAKGNTMGRLGPDGTIYTHGGSFTRIYRPV